MHDFNAIAREALWYLMSFDDLEQTLWLCLLVGLILGLHFQLLPKWRKFKLLAWTDNLITFVLPFVLLLLACLIKFHALTPYQSVPDWLAFSRLHPNYSQRNNIDECVAMYKERLQNKEAVGVFKLEIEQCLKLKEISPAQLKAEQEQALILLKDHKKPDQQTGLSIFKNPKP